MSVKSDAETRGGCGCLIFFGLILMLIGAIIWFGAPVLFVCGLVLVLVGLIFTVLLR